MKLNWIQFSLVLQDDLLDDDDEDEDRLILDRSPDETGSQDLDELESDDDLEGTLASDGERIIYPWMKKIHVAGVGKSRAPFAKKETFFLNTHRRRKRKLSISSSGRFGRSEISARSLLAIGQHYTPSRAPKSLPDLCFPLDPQTPCMTRVVIPSSWKRSKNFNSETAQINSTPDLWPQLRLPHDFFPPLQTPEKKTFTPHGKLSTW